MGVVVMKFGGTSVATPEKILLAAQRAMAEQKSGAHVAVVVSARGHTTDELIELARKVHPNPPGRELDMLVATGEQESIALLAMAIDHLGGSAESLTGGQVGIETDSIHGKARIRRIETERIQRAFDQGKIAIVAGFQGVDADRNITTLGRGGSDTTAVAIAAALRADICEIYTDVDGVFSTDPRIVPNARKLEQISYDEMLELASVGAGVMHSRSIEFAKKFGVVIHVRNSGHNHHGTVIRPEAPEMEHIVARGAALVLNEARVTLRDVPDRPGAVFEIFQRLADARIVVDMIVQNIAQDGKTAVSFTVSEAELPQAIRLAEAAAENLGAGRVDFSTQHAKLSLVGLGMRTHAGVAERMFQTLARIGVNIDVITTSEIKISVLVDRGVAVRALMAIHEEFGLHEKLIEAVADSRFPTKAKTNMAADAEERLKAIVGNLQGMEDILVTDVEIDDDQGRVTLYGVPDRPGVCAAVFAAVARANVAVDMIVQSVGDDGTTHLSFTTALRSDLEPAATAARVALLELGAENGQVVADSGMVKVSVRGVGVRTHCEVAVKMFNALAQAGVNIQLINTSELHITVVLDQKDGQRAAELLRKEFGLQANGVS
jgi:aspartate kinase